MKNITLFIIAILLLGCASKNDIEKQLSRSDLIKKSFTEDDIPILAKMIEFTDSLVLENNNSQDIDLAYHDYLNSMYEAYENEGLLPSLDSKSVYPFLLGLDSITFDKIWRVRTSYNWLKYMDSIYINPDNFMHIDFKMGPFLNFTKDLASENINYQGIDKSMKLAGDISIMAWIYILKENEKFDYNNIDERLWISINLLRCTETTDINTLKE